MTAFTVFEKHVHFFKFLGRRQRSQFSKVCPIFQNSWLLTAFTVFENYVPFMKFLGRWQRSQFLKACPIFLQISWPSTVFTFFKSISHFFTNFLAVDSVHSFWKTCPIFKISWLLTAFTVFEKYVQFFKFLAVDSVHSFLKTCPIFKILGCWQRSQIWKACPIYEIS